MDARRKLKDRELTAQSIEIPIFAIKRKILSHEISLFLKVNLFLMKYDLSVASTETKYIKLKTKTQNNIVIFGFFSKK